MKQLRSSLASTANNYDQGRMLLKARTNKDMTIKEVAEKVGVSTSRIFRLESYGATISLAEAVKLDQVLECGLLNNDYLERFKL